MKITGLRARDIRFPTSDALDGSDAVHTDPDYSCVYVELESDAGPVGHGLTFTLGRGNEVVREATLAYAPLVVGRDLGEITAAFGAFWNRLANESQLRWIGPQKGASHMAMGAVVNAIWDLWAKAEGKPVWQLVCDLSPEELVRCIDFSWITDLVGPDEALAMLQQHAPTKAERIARVREHGVPAYTTSAGWLGYDDDKIRRLCREGIAAGWTHFKLKVGQDRDDDRRRCRIVREEIGDERFLMVDANQRWDVDQAIDWMAGLAEFRPHWIEEPTCADDVLGHARIAREVAPIGVATGEAAQNRVIFKQLLQADAISFCQIDSCRLAGVNEVLAVQLMAAKKGVPVCPHAGGVGLCEYVQHLSIIDYVAIAGTFEGRITEWVDHLHEHFLDPCRVDNGAYVVPEAPGYSIEMRAESLADHEWPDGSVWRARRDA